jgi:hypothetical protein
MGPGFVLIFWLAGGLVGTGFFYAVFRNRKAPEIVKLIVIFLPFVPFFGTILFLFLNSPNAADPNKTFENIFSVSDLNGIRPLEGWTSAGTDYGEYYASFQLDQARVDQLIQKYDIRPRSDIYEATNLMNNDGPPWWPSQECSEMQFYWSQYSVGNFDDRMLVFCPKQKIGYAQAWLID